MVYQTVSGTNNPNSTASEQNKKIFLGGLSYNTTDETLRGFCSNFGKMTDCLVMRTSEGKSRGFGFVTYEDASSVEDFMHSRPHTIDNRQIEPKRAMPREDKKSTEAHSTVKKLFIAGVRDGIDEDNLRQYFSRFGNITEILVMKDRDGKLRGFAFISFDDYDAVDKAILEKPHLINGRTLDIKKAVPKDKTQERSNSRNQSSSNRNNFRNTGWDDQQGYNYNSSMSSNTGPFQQSFNSFGQNQGPQQSLMNYNPFNNNNTNQPFIQSSYGQNQQQGYGPNNFGRMNNPTHLNDGGYNNGPTSAMPFGNSNSYGIPSQSYGGTHIPQQQSHRGGPIRAGRGRGGGPSGNNNRSAPYPSRGGRGRGSANHGGRGRGRGQ